MYPRVCQDDPGLGGILYRKLGLAALHSAKPISGCASRHLASCRRKGLTDMGGMGCKLSFDNGFALV